MLHLKRIILALAAFVVLTCGCASLVTNRGVQVEASDLSISSGLEVLHTVADQSGLIVQGPSYETKDRFYYDAWPPPDRANNKLHIGMFVDKGEGVTFSVVVHGTAKDFQTAQSAAELLEQELAKRHVKYRTWQGTAIPPP